MAYGDMGKAVGVLPAALAIASPGMQAVIGGAQSLRFGRCPETSAK
jgi:hypothetical protein